MDGRSLIRTGCQLGSLSSSSIMMSDILRGLNTQLSNNSTTPGGSEQLMEQKYLL